VRYLPAMTARWRRPRRQELRLRAEIDRLDEEVLRGFPAAPRSPTRSAASRAGNLYRPEREAQVLRRIAELNPGPLPAVVWHIFARSCRPAWRWSSRCASPISARPGTFTESAAKKHFGSAPNFTACGDHRRGVPRRRIGQCRLRRGAGGEFHRGRRRPHARPAAADADQDLRRSHAAHPPAPAVARRNAWRT
jgi:hypothetical protein